MEVLGVLGGSNFEISIYVPPFPTTWILIHCVGNRRSMASKIPQLQSKVNQASQVVAKNGASYYKLLLEQNKHYIQDPPTIEKCQSLANQLFYTRLASIPLRYNSFWKELNHAKDMMKNWQDLNRENVGFAALFGLECFAWFWGGEIVGRGFTFTGYHV